MAVITIFSGLYCSGEEITRNVASNLGYQDKSDQLLPETARRCGVPQEKLLRAMQGPPFFFNKYTHLREKCIAHLKKVAADFIAQDNIVYHGFAAPLFPRDVPHVLKVALVSTREARIAHAEGLNISAKDAQRMIQKDDDQRREWIEYLYECSTWDKKLYDVMIPMHTTSPEKAVEIVYENAHKPPLATTPQSRQMVEDFRLACEVGVTLADKNYDVEVTCKDREVALVLNKYVMRLEQYQEDLKKIAGAVPGVKDVAIRVGPKFQEPSIYPRLDMELSVPAKILLVDDEKEFIHTLSERLQTRMMDSEIVYDGEEALAAVAEEEPEVMILDLKMPGIDGIEVLRRVKKEHPQVEVIILTGHGSEKEEKLAGELGAFAYLQKPVDINVLTQTMKRAYKKIADAREAERSKQPSED